MQDELQRLGRVTTQVLLHDRKSVKEHGQAGKLPEGISGEEFQIVTAIRRFQVRVLDHELREAVEGFMNLCTEASLHTSGGDRDEVLARLREKEMRVSDGFRVVNDLLGERLRRELDRRSLVTQNLDVPQ